MDMAGRSSREVSVDGGMFHFETALSEICFPLNNMTHSHFKSSSPHVEPTSSLYLCIIVITFQGHALSLLRNVQNLNTCLTSSGKRLPDLLMLLMCLYKKMRKDCLQHIFLIHSQFIFQCTNIHICVQCFLLYTRTSEITQDKKIEPLLRLN
jgi:hypothetical protein